MIQFALSRKEGGIWDILNSDAEDDVSSCASRPPLVESTVPSEAASQAEAKEEQKQGQAASSSGLAATDWSEWKPTSKKTGEQKKKPFAQAYPGFAAKNPLLDPNITAEQKRAVLQPPLNLRPVVMATYLCRLNRLAKQKCHENQKGALALIGRRKSHPKGRASLLLNKKEGRR